LKSGLINEDEFVNNKLIFQTYILDKELNKSLNLNVNFANTINNFDIIHISKKITPLFSMIEKKSSVLKRDCTKNINDSSKENLFEATSPFI
jgi:hypothetical protein